MTQETTTAATVVRRSITVEASIERAFMVYTERCGSWSPPEHHLGPADLADVLIEPRVGGRWYEKGVDGSECDWGQVLAWDPPHHVALTWQINAPDGPEGGWAFDPDPERASRVDVRFVAEGPTTTRVELEHSKLEHHGEHWQMISAGVADAEGWELSLGLYAKAVEATAEGA